MRMLFPLLSIIIVHTFYASETTETHTLEPFPQKRSLAEIMGEAIVSFLEMLKYASETGRAQQNDTTSKTLEKHPTYKQLANPVSLQNSIWNFKNGTLFIDAKIKEGSIKRLNITFPCFNEELITTLKALLGSVEF